MDVAPRGRGKADGKPAGRHTSGDDADLQTGWRPLGEFHGGKTGHDLRWIRERLIKSDAGREVEFPGVGRRFPEGTRDVDGKNTVAGGGLKSRGDENGAPAAAANRQHTYISDIR